MTKRSSLAALAAVTLAAAAAALPTPAAAVDLSWSAFGTLSWAQSDRDWRYRRYVDDGGSYKADSVLGGQLDLRLNPQWSATVQLKLAAPESRDEGLKLSPSWAFVAWRPTDEWLLRVGKLRLPLYMHSESLDVGVSHDMARLPVEMYSIAPTNDANGISASHTWELGSDGSELALEYMGGKTRTWARQYLRDGIPGEVPAGAFFTEVDVTMQMLVGSLRLPATQVRLGVGDARTRHTGTQAMPQSFPWVSIMPGVGYWRINEALPGPEIPSVSTFHNSVFTAGVEHRFGEGWQVAAEFARTRQRNSEVGSDTHGGYVALFKTVDAFTPYVSWARLGTNATQMAWYERLVSNQVPAAIPGAALINAGQRVAAESIYAAEQSTVALGSAYDVHPGGKLKLEWARTKIGRVSRMVDTPAGHDSPHDTRVDTWTLSYSFAF